MSSSLVSFATRLLWPDRCCACRAYVNPDRAFCPLCELSIEAVRDPCEACALPRNPAVAHVCPWPAAPFSTASAPLLYDGALIRAIVALKHGRRRDVARALGIYLAPTILSAQRAGITTVLAVPLHPRRLRQRGFNQSLDLASYACVHLGAKRAPAIATALLRRRTDTAPLAKESAAVRRGRVFDAFEASSQVAGHSVLVIDDVMTTGATLTACAVALRAAGAAEVHVAALARTVL